MKTIPTPPTLFLIPILILMVAFSSCTDKEVLPDAPSVQALENGVDDVSNPYEGPCAGSVLYPISYSVISAADYPGFGLAIQIHPTVPIFSDPGCICIRQQYCISLTFPQRSVEKVAIAYVPGEPTEIDVLQVNDKGGYLGQCDWSYTAPEPVQPLQVSPNGTHTICINSGDVVLFRFPRGIPPYSDLEGAVIRATGLCIIDNIPDPYGPCN